MKPHTFLNLGLCPYCASGRVSVTSTTRPRRRLRCRVCLRSWATFEVIDSTDWLPLLLNEFLHQGRFAHLPPRTRQAVAVIVGEYLTGPGPY